METTDEILKNGGDQDHVIVVEIEGQGHGIAVLDRETATAKDMIAQGHVIGDQGPEIAGQGRSLKWMILSYQSRIQKIFWRVDVLFRCFISNFFEGRVIEIGERIGEIDPGQMKGQVEDRNGQDLEIAKGEILIEIEER